MKAGKTNIEVGTKIKFLEPSGIGGATGKITHAFGFLGFYDHGAIAGAYVDDHRKYGFPFPEVNLFAGDFEIINQNKGGLIK